MRKLDAASDVVCLLTARSLGRPWILYEAGVAKGKLDIPVYGLALGVPLARVSTGPFAQFQNCDDNADSLAKLVEQLVRRLPHADPDHDTVMGQVNTFKMRIDEILAAEEADGAEPDAESAEPSSAKLFEEIKIMFQDLPSRIDRMSDRPDRREFFMRRIHPGMIEELVMTTSRGEPNVGVAALIVTSLVREDVPWLYTMAVELYRATLSNDRATVRRAYQTFTRAVESLEMGPFLHEMLGPRRKAGRELQLLLQELPHLLSRYVPQLEGVDESAGLIQEDADG